MEERTPQERATIEIQGREFAVSLPNGGHLSVNMVFTEWPPRALGIDYTDPDGNVHPARFVHDSIEPRAIQVARAGMHYRRVGDVEHASPPPTPGVRTSEFWLAVLAVVGLILAAVLNESALPALAAAIPAVGYAMARAKVKQ